MSTPARLTRWRNSTRLKKVELWLEPETIERIEAFAALHRISRARALDEVLRTWQALADVHREVLDAYRRMLFVAERRVLVERILGPAMERLKASLDR